MDVHGFAHITGGGLTDNVPRVLPDGLGVRLDPRAWRREPVWDWIRESGRISDAEMHRTFNCGIGMVVVVARADGGCRARAARRRRRAGLRHRRGRRGRGRADRLMALPFAVLISGRGSNMLALERATRDGAHRRPHQRRDLRSRRRRRPRRGARPRPCDHGRRARRRRGSRGPRTAARRGGRRERRRTRRARGLHAHPATRLRARLAGTAPQHPPGPAARLPRPAHAPARARSGRAARTAARCISSSRNSTPDPQSSRAGSRCGPGEDEAALSARVQRLEHIVYPRAVGWFAAGRLACRDGAAWLDGRPAGP